MNATLPKSPDQSGAQFAPRSFADQAEIEAYRKIAAMLKNTPIPDNEILANIAMFNVRASFVRMQFMYTLYMRRSLRMVSSWSSGRGGGRTSLSLRRSEVCTNHTI